MKRLLSLCLMSLCLCGAKAQMGDTTPNWTKTIYGVENSNDAYRHAPIAVTTDGNVYSTGIFNQMIVTDKFFLEPIAQSSYLAKYDKDGSEIWAVALAGTSTITSIATDADNNVYIAGCLSDQVIFNTTSGEAATLEGVKAEDGSYIPTQITSFIAKYDADGVLKATKTFLPSAHPDIANYLNMGYMQMESNNKFLIEHIECDGKDVYASALYIGQTISDNHTFLSSLNDVWGFLINDVQHYTLFTVSAEDLSNTSVVAELKPTEALQFSETQAAPLCMTFTLDNGSAYIGAIGKGDITLATGNKNTDFNFSVSYNNEGEPVTEYGHILASVNEGNITCKTFSSTSTNDNKQNETISTLKVEGNTLYAGGLFYGTLAYDNEKTSTMSSDIYAVALDKTTFEQKWNVQSAFNEGEINHYNEIFTAMVVNDGEVYLYGYAEESSSHNVESALNYICKNGTATNAGNVLVTGGDVNGSVLALASLNETQSIASAYTVTPGSSVKNISAQTMQRIGNTFYFAEPANIKVYNMQGQTVIEENQAESFNAEKLNPGLYIISNGKENIKIQR